jgi:hypothetical protein
MSKDRTRRSLSHPSCTSVTPSTARLADPVPKLNQVVAAHGVLAGMLNAARPDLPLTISVTTLTPVMLGPTGGPPSAEPFYN